MRLDANIETILFHHRFPVDIRHNAKIFRERLAAWAGRQRFMRALVTGGGGFLGRAIIEQLLARGRPVKSFARGSYPDLAARGVEVVQGDSPMRTRFVELSGSVMLCFTWQRRQASGGAKPTSSAPT